MKDFPVIYITAAFILGILVSGFLNLPLDLLWWAVLTISISVFVLLRKGKNYGFDILILVLFFTLGLLSLAVSRISCSSEVIPSLVHRRLHAVGYVVDDPRITDKSTRFMIKPERISCGDKIYQFKDLWLDCTLRKSYPLRYGQKVDVEGKIGNDRRGGYVLYAGEVTVRGEKILNPFKYFSLVLRNRAEEQFFRHFSLREAAFLSALFLGKREHLDYHDYLPFKKTGTAHVLSISGLHTGMFVAVCNFLLAFAGFKRKPRYILMFVLLVFWIFFSGLRVPVIRASIIAACFFAGSLLERRTHLLSMIFFSAMVILLVEPGQLFSVSFQLSYLCVLSIVTLMPFFDKARGKICPAGSGAGFLSAARETGYFLRDIALVSIIVFLSTLPVISFHFGIVSFISILANVLLVPLLFIIMGLCFMFFVPIGFVQEAVKSLLSLFVVLFNLINAFLGEIPFSHCYLKFSLKALFMYYTVFILLCAFYFIRRRKQSEIPSH